MAQVRAATGDTCEFQEFAGVFEELQDRVKRVRASFSGLKELLHHEGNSKAAAVADNSAEHEITGVLHDAQESIKDTVFTAKRMSFQRLHRAPTPAPVGRTSAPR